MYGSASKAFLRRFQPIAISAKGDCVSSLNYAGGQGDTAAP